MKKNMKNAIIVLTVAIAVAGGTLALAQSSDAPASHTVNDLALSAEACHQLTAYQPGTDGSADYQPGVDVTGKPVVEADIGGSSIPAPEVVTFNLSVDMAQYLGITTTPRPEGFVSLGTISVLPDGRVLRDGQPLETQAESALRALCAEQKAP